MAGLAAGINAGLSQGMQLGMQVQGLQRQKEIDAQAAEDRQFNRGLQQQSADLQQKRFGMEEQRYEQEQKRQRTAALIKDTDDQLAGVQRSLADLYKQGAKDDDERATFYRKQAQDLYARKRNAYLELHGEQLKNDWTEAQDTFKALQEGKASPRDLPTGKLYQALSLAYGDDIRKVADPKFGEALNSFDDAMEGGDLETALNYFNQIAGSEIGMAIGKLSPDGAGRITGQRVARIIPDQQNPDYVFLDLENDVERVDGAKGKYMAPITEDRDPGDSDLKRFAVKDLLDYVGGVGELHTLMQDPEVRSKLDEDLQSDAPMRFETNRQALLYLGADPDAIMNGDLEKTDLGDRIEWTNKAGKVVRSAKKGAAPRMFASGGIGGGRSSVGKYIGDVEEQVAAGTISAEEGEQLIQSALQRGPYGTTGSAGRDPTFANAGKVKLLNGQAISEDDLAKRYEAKYPLSVTGQRSSSAPDFDAWRDQQVQEQFRSTYRPPAEAAPGQPAAAPQGGLQQPKLPETIARPPQGGPKAGDVMKGYRFKGGNPADKNNWEKV